MSEYDHWPTCAVCSERVGSPVPVEEYEIPADNVELGGLEHDTVKQIVVIAKCSHGRGFRPGTVDEQKSVIDVPEWWGVAHIDDAIRGLIFFAPGGPRNPRHNLVTSLS